MGQASHVRCRPDGRSSGRIIRSTDAFGSGGFHAHIGRGICDLRAGHVVAWEIPDSRFAIPVYSGLRLDSETCYTGPTSSISERKGITPVQ